MRKILTVMMTMLTVCSMAQEEVCSVLCAEGGVIEKGCTLVQHNSVNVTRINMKSCDNYVIAVVGKKEAMAKEDGSNDACYFELKLADGKFFRQGDALNITGMRNINQEYKSSLYFVYDNGTVVEDNNVWNNLGILQDMTFGGGTEAKGNKAGTEPLKEYSLFPSNFTFMVPAEADGCSSVCLTRNDSECILYLTKISMTRTKETGIDTVKNDKQQDHLYNLSGQRTDAKTQGIIIRNGKKTVNR